MNILNYITYEDCRLYEQLRRTNWKSDNDVITGADPAELMKAFLDEMKRYKAKSIHYEAHFNGFSGYVTIRCIKVDVQKDNQVRIGNRFGDCIFIDFNKVDRIELDGEMVADLILQLKSEGLLLVDFLRR